MAKSARYSVKEAWQIILGMPHRSDSDDPEFSDRDYDIENESVLESLSDSHSPITMGSIPSPASRVRSLEWAWSSL